MDSSKCVVWSIGGEHSRVYFRPIGDVYHASNWDVHYGDEVWTRLGSHVGYTSISKGIEKREDLNRIESILTSTGGTFDLVKLPYDSVVIYVSSPCGMRSFRSFVSYADQDGFLVYPCDNSSEGFDASLSILRPLNMHATFGEVGLRSLAAWLISGGSLKEYPNG